MIVYFDIETNGFIDDLDKCVCLAYCIDSEDPVIAKNPVEILHALEVLSSASILVGHNCLGFDLPALSSLHPKWSWSGKVRDTLVLARLAYPDRRDLDFAEQSSGRSTLGGVEWNMPSSLIGSHSLEAWGYRLGMHKDVYVFDSAKIRDLEYSPELGEYCAQDVRVTRRLHEALHGLDPRAVELEHEFASLIHRQMSNGIGFDVDSASALYSTLSARREELITLLQKAVPPTEIVLKTKTKLVPFNPGSRQQIAKAMMDMYGWKPEEYTPTGEVKIDEAILDSLDNPTAKMLSEYLMIQKRIGMLAEGDEAWLRVAKNGRIHGYVNHNGAVTGRCTHRGPNMAQVPSVGSAFGSECRSLFVPSPGFSMVGVDASGLELRCLAHYMLPYEGGREFMEELLTGDIHSANQKAAGLPTRSAAKSFIYAFLYGAGPETLGRTVGGGKAEGKRMQSRFLEKVPALRGLKADVEAKALRTGRLVGLDGRILRIRSVHAALNTLLQSAGAIVMKKATCVMNERLNESGISFLQVAHVHDEVQFEVRSQDAEHASRIVKDSIAEAGNLLGFRCPLAGESRVGRNWAETH